MTDRRLFTRVGPIRFRWLVLGWMVAELATFAVLVRTVGLGTTVLLGIATTVIGLIMLRRLGTAALFRLRGVLDGGQPPEGALLEGMLGGLAALLLIVPGFLANFAGLALASPSVRRKVLTSYGGGGPGGSARLRRSSAEVVDLAPTDWRVERP